MYARVRKYGILFAALLIAVSCTDEDAVGVEPGTSAPSGVPITFRCAADETETRAVNGYTGNLTATNHQLHYAGFGVFMAHSSGTIPDLMYNQQVEYTFFGDGSGDGYWTYSPVKYWPAQPEGVCFYAYAPYVEVPAADFADDPDNTGIVGVSANNVASPYILYARAKHPEHHVDLLWKYLRVTAAMLTDGRPKMSEAVTLEMHHALSRVKVSLGITNGASLAVGSKLLIKRVTFTGSVARTARLDLSSDKNGSDQYIPTWTNHDLQATTIFVDGDPETNTDSYGIIAEGIRYITGLPAAWQPTGLPHVNYDAENDATKTNLLCMGDAPTYLYLIPQAELALTCVLDYCIIASDGTKTDYSKTINNPPGHTFSIAPLNGNTTYDVTLKITI